MEEKQKIDFWLLALTLILACLGLIMVYSSSMYRSMEEVGSGTYYFKKQAIHLFLGMVLMMVLSKMNYKGYLNIKGALLGFGLITLIALLVINEVKGYDVNRWIRIAGIGFQPSEFMKIVLIIFLSGSIANMGENIRDFKKGFMPLMAIVGITFILVFKEPNLGVSALLLTIGMYIIFLGRARLTHILMLVIPSVAAIVLMVTEIPYMKKRWMDFISEESAYQIKQSIISVGSGGLFGVGLGNSSQKFAFLPELHTDFVFSIFAEELGYLGVSIFLALTLMFVMRGFRIARQAPDMFGFLLASGISMLIAIEIFVNIGVAVRLLPTTGMTLPFISYGGSSLLTSFIAAGILLNISKQGNAEMTLSREFDVRRSRKTWL